MVVYAEITIPASGFRIGRAFAELSGVRVELDRVVPTADAVVPFLWVRGARPEAVVRVTRERSAVEDIALLDRAAEEALYRVVWNRRARDVAVSIADSALALVTGAGTAEEWTFEFRGEHREPLSAFVRELRADGTPVTVGRLTEDRSRAPRRRNPLTDAQFEALGLAYAEGYFEEPRAATLEELAAEAEVTPQAFGGRLRRAVASLVAERVGAAAH
jgi:predicted DNA binding protein